MEPVVDQQLSVGHKIAGGVGSFLLPDDVDDTTRRRTDGTLGQVSTKELSTLNEDVLIIRAGPGLLVANPLETNLRNNQGEDLLSCPEGLRLEDSWLGELVILVFRPHEKLHDKLLLNEGVPKREEHDTQQGVLHDTHNWLVILGRDDLVGDSHDLLDFSLGLIGLRDMHVHLISVEVSIVRSSHREIQPESTEGKHFHTMSHERHLMEGGLTVEDHIVIVLEMSLDLVAGLDVLV